MIGQAPAPRPDPTAWLCLRCGCIHGWIGHPDIRLVQRHVRYPGEDIWWCPSCGQEHRTFDGSAFGQREKKWRQGFLSELREYLNDESARFNDMMLDPEARERFVRFGILPADPRGRGRG